MQGKPDSAHTITLTDRSSALLTGVSSVECFSDQIVVLQTAFGNLSLSGENLNISRLSLDAGELSVSGEIRAIEYTDRNKLSDEGFFRRLFG